MKRRHVLKLLPAVAWAVAPGRALAQAYPNKPITLLVGGAAGSVPDVMVRPVAEKLSAVFGAAGAGRQPTGRRWRHRHAGVAAQRA